MEKYALGLDFGTLNGRAILVNVKTGEELTTTVYSYPNGVIDEVLPDNKTKLGPDWALQNPVNYLGVLKYAVPEVLKKSNVSPEDIIGIGVDFTSCTVLPIDKQGTPLCLKDKWKSNPHSWVKLWKHHSAESYANRLKDIAFGRTIPIPG